MAVVWVLLGASRYPAKFFQTYRGDLREAKVPTHLFEGIVPDLIRDRDLALSNLAASSCRIERISSVGDMGIIVVSSKFFGRANDWCYISCLSAYLLNLAPHFCISDMLAVPRQ